MEYRVYVRFEDTPAVARKNSEQKPDPEYGPLTLEAVSGANPGEETPILHEALEDARKNGKFIALYRGKHAGYNRRGAEIFTPVGLAWCKDSFELAQMLGIDLKENGNEADPEPQTVTTDEVSDFRSQQVISNRQRNGQQEQGGNSATSSKNLTPKERFQQSLRGKVNNTSQPQADSSSRGGLIWTGIIAGSFVGAFIVVYGLAKLIG